MSVCLSSVTLSHPRHRLELFSNIFALPNSSGAATVCVKMLGKNLNEFLGIVQVKYKGYEKLAFLDQNLALFRKRYKIRP